MQRDKWQFENLYSDGEKHLLGLGQKIRQHFLAPLAKLLLRLGIGPDLLSFVSVALGIGFFLLAPIDFPLAFWLLMASLVCDALDGVEARVKGSNSQRGSFTDMFCDQAVVAFSVAGLVWEGSIEPVLAILFVYTYIGLSVFLILHSLLQVSSRWIIRPSRMLLYVAIALKFFFAIDLLNYLLLLYLLALPMLALSFWRLRSTL